MNFDEYREKYRRMESEYPGIKIGQDIENYESDLSKHPNVNKDWLNYARDQKFNFSGLRLPPDSDSSFYEYLNGDIQNLISVLTIQKEFTMCPTCFTRWILDISLNGNYNVYDECGQVVIDTLNEHNKYMEYYELPKCIETVMDLQKVLDVIEMNMHKVEK
jgi:hypothetical protein